MKRVIFSLATVLVLAACSTTQVQNTTNDTMTAETKTVIDRSVQPKPGPAPKVKIGKPQSFTLDNGLKVMVVENNKLPRVSFSLSLDNPPLAEGNKKGVRDLLSSMIGNGTSQISKDDFNEEVDFYGANVSMNAGGAYASTLSKFFPQVLGLVSSGVLDPLLTQEDFDSEKAKFVEGLKTEEKSASAIAGNLRDALTYGMNHPYGEFVTDKTLKNVTLNDVKKFYKDNFVPENGYLVVVGDISFKKAKKLVTEAFGNWKKGTVVKQNYTEPKNLASQEIDFVDVPNAVQSEVATINVTNLKMTDPDYFAAIMANQILGGGGEGRLFLNLREDKAWTYGSYSRIKGDKDVSKFMTTASVRNAVTDSAVVEMLGEIGRIRTELVSDEELRNAKAKYIGNFVMSVEKPEVVARQALRTATQDLPADFYENYIKNINAVTKEDVRAVAKKYFGKDNARIVVVGKGEEVLPSLQSMGLPVRYFNRYGEEVEAPKKKEISADVTAMGVINNYLQAIGGKDKAKALKSVKATFEMTGAAPQPIQGELMQLAPNKEKMVMTMNGMNVMTQVFDGTTLKVSGMMGNSEKSGEEVADKAAKKGIVSQAFYTKDQVELKGISDLNGKDTYKVEVTEGKETTTEFYDVKSGLLIQIASVIQSPQGDSTMLFLFDDYKAVEGIMMPHKITQSAGPQNIVMIFSDYVLNKGITEADFK